MNINEPQRTSYFKMDVRTVVNMAKTSLNAIEAQRNELLGILNSKEMEVHNLSDRRGFFGRANPKKAELHHMLGELKKEIPKRHESVRECTCKAFIKAADIMENTPNMKEEDRYFYVSLSDLESISL
jgi:hypothetical protein